MMNKISQKLPILMNKWGYTIHIYISIFQWPPQQDGFHEWNHLSSQIPQISTLIVIDSFLLESSLLNNFKT